jgi:ethanolamine utilization protein EutS
MGAYDNLDIPERIVQELVPGKEITIAHLIASPDPVLYKGLGIGKTKDDPRFAVGLITISPAETAIIAADVALKASGIEIGSVDRYNGSLIITGTVSEVEASLEAVLGYVKEKMRFSVCEITRT